MQSGETWWIDLSDSVGHEQAGTRPGIILRVVNGMCITIPLTSNIRSARFSHTYLISPSPENGLTGDSIALVFQIVTLDRSRFIEKLGIIPGDQMEVIQMLLKDLFHIE